MKPEGNSGRLLSVAEVASRTDIAERTIRELIRLGRIQCVRPFGLRRVLIPESVLRDLVRAVVE
jgi:excisionase family DNA binding protein